MSFYDGINQYASNIAFISESHPPFTYQDLVNFSDSLAGHISDKALVFLISDNCLESISGYIGFLRARAVPLLLQESIDSAKLDHLLEVYRPQLIWMSKEKSKLISNSKPIFNFGNYVLLELSQNLYPIFPGLAQLLTTSGSTGSPMLVRQSYVNIDSNTEAIAQYLGITQMDRPITTLPMSYTYGLSIISSHLLKGCTILLTNRSVVEKEFWSFFKAHAPTTFGGVPYLYEILKKIRFLRMDLPSLRTLTQAGGAMSASLIAEFSELLKAKGVRLYVMYGQTEATARMSYFDPQLHPTKIGSVGKPIPGGFFSLVGEDNQLIDAIDEVGELVYRGDNVALGYANQSTDLNRGNDFFGELKTGDLAKKDEDGFYYIVGRKKRFIKLFGHRISLDEVEQMLREYGCGDCACDGDDSILILYLSKGANAHAVSLAISNITGIHISAILVKVVKSVPRNSSGKILYQILKDQHFEQPIS
jgi:acyl-CoA synthetase (AMP-forming)/AMP-acid ligase II